MLGNTSVAWFSIGVIPPLLFQSKTLFDFLFTTGVSLFIALWFGICSLYLMKGIK